MGQIIPAEVNANTNPRTRNFWCTQKLGQKLGSTKGLKDSGTSEVAEKTALIAFINEGDGAQS